MEYFIVMAVVLAAVISSGAIFPGGGMVRANFEGYFKRSLNAMGYGNATIEAAADTAMEGQNVSGAQE